MSDYQAIGARWLASKRYALLADDMGLGKSKQAVEASVLIGAEKILVICPAVARVNWVREFKLWSVLHADFEVLTGPDLRNFRAVVSFDFACAHREILCSKTWDLVIVDESHFIKEPEAKRTKAVFGKSGIIRSTMRMWCLSGTPAPNHVGEFWPLLFTFGRTPLLPDDFIQRFCRTRPVYRGGKRILAVIGNKRSEEAELQKLLDPVMLRRLKRDVMKDLPPISYEQFVVQADISWQDISDRSAVQWCNLVREEDFLRNVLGTGGSNGLSGIAESVSTIRRHNGMCKVKPICELIASELEVGAYDKIILFAVHRDVVNGIAEGLKAFGSVVLHGGTPVKLRQAAIDGFQSDPACRVFVGNIQAAGTAITLTAAAEVGLVEESWTPGENAQAIMRAHRRTQTRPVRVRQFSIADSIDEAIGRVNMRKTQELTRVLTVGND